jgi:hypothetical protein
MAGLKTNSDLENTLTQVLEQEKQKQASKYEYNKVLFSWQANDRPTYSFTGGQKTIFTALLLFMGLYFFWVSQPILTLVTAAIFFVLFALISFPAQLAEHSIETLGIRSMDFLYGWEDLVSFWIAEKEGVIIMYVETRLKFPGRLVFLIESFQEAVAIVKLVIEKLPYRHLSEPQTGLEKAFEGKYVIADIFVSAAKDIEKKKSAEKTTEE